jgi:geranylgeranyl diphosphate synthase type I
MKKFLDLKVTQAKKISPEAHDMVEILKKYSLSSGKRIRPALMHYAYLALGGKNKKESLKLAMALEFIHAFLLIHDDIMDRDDLRRGMQSVHCTYRKLALKNNYSMSASHYGNSQAISVGDMCYSFVTEIISQSRIDCGTKDKLLKKISDIVFNTTIGQFHDVFAAAAKKGINTNHVMTILEYKTARYTVEGPLHMGAILAGASDKDIEVLSSFAIPLGVAFQIQDDILGVFGSSAETGKPVGADIREGKKTLLIVKALELASAKQKKILLSILGDHFAKAKQIDYASRMIIDSGSLDYSKKMEEKLVKDSCMALEQSNLSKKSKEFFYAVADFMIKRKN